MQHPQADLDRAASRTRELRHSLVRLLGCGSTVNELKEALTLRIAGKRLYEPSNPEVLCLDGDLAAVAGVVWCCAPDLALTLGVDLDPSRWGSPEALARVRGTRTLTQEDYARVVGPDKDFLDWLHLQPGVARRQTHFTFARLLSLLRRSLLSRSFDLTESCSPLIYHVQFTGYEALFGLTKLCINQLPDILAARCRLTLCDVREAPEVLPGVQQGLSL